MKTPVRNLLVSLLLGCLLTGPATAQQDGSLDEQIQSIKQQTLELNRDLFILEEELLYPSDTRLGVFLSLDVGEFFALDAVKLSIDGVVVTHYLYTERQVDALRRGGVHRLYEGNIKAGEHEIVAVFTGKGPGERDYRRATERVVEKARGPKYLELTITDSTALNQPEFAVKEW
ncbi:MAG: AraC family transcriptional regulator [Halieaceae bacterium]|nr:AraC family transcriptional regulator [Halieaceae bacterium]MCP5164153.1 AraC family transcriptional regulator [Pseudomonadales bacterium]MCP5203771.1 AraC family transcriptional regulator [Pseudomonadales bacterium]